MGISWVCERQWEGDVVKVVLDLGGRKGRFERGVLKGLESFCARGIQHDVQFYKNE